MYEALPSPPSPEKVGIYPLEKPLTWMTEIQTNKTKHRNGGNRVMDRAEISKTVMSVDKIKYYCHETMQGY